MKTKVLNPVEFSGDINGDFGFEIDGIKSTKGYASRIGAKNAMFRLLDKLQK